MERDCGSSNVPNGTEGLHGSTPTAKKYACRNFLFTVHRRSPRQSILSGRKTQEFIGSIHPTSYSINMAVRHVGLTDIVCRQDRVCRISNRSKGLGSALRTIFSNHLHSNHDNWILAVGVKHRVRYWFNLLTVDEPIRAFAEAVRFAIVVSLRDPGLKNISLYSLCASTSVGSQRPVFDGRHIRWTVISLVLLLLFTVQTTA